VSNTTVTVITGLGSSDLEVSYGSRGPAGATGATGATGAAGPQGDRAGLKYRFETQTNDGAPSAGHLKFNSATLSAVTRISIRDTDFDGNDTSALLALIDDSTSTIKARVVIRSNSNSDTSHFNFLVTSVTDEGNHHHINGTYVSGSAFADNEIVTFDFYVTGNEALWNFRGEWVGSDNEAYNIGDIVTYNGSLWYCILYINGTVGYFPDAYQDIIWQLIAAKGDTGSQGPAGPTGPEPSLTIADNANTAITLADTDNNKVVRCTAATAVTVTVPSTLAAGFSCMVIQAGTGQVTFVAGSSATLNSFGNLLKTAGQHAPASIMRVASGMYNVSGNLV